MNKSKCYEAIDLIKLGAKSIAQGPYSLIIMFANESMDSKRVEHLLKKYVKGKMIHQDDIITLVELDSEDSLKSLIKELVLIGLKDNLEVVKAENSRKNTLNRFIKNQPSGK